MAGIGVARAADAALADCDSPGVARGLHALPANSTATVDATARAVWFDRRWLRWPGIGAEGRFRIYASSEGQLRLGARGRMRGADAVLELAVARAAPPAELAEHFKYVAAGTTLNVPSQDLPRLPELLRGQLVLTHEDASGRVLESTAMQLAGVLDDLYAGAESEPALGASVNANATTLKLWAPTARAVSACLYATGSTQAAALETLQRDATTGLWSTALAGDRSGQYYTFLVDVFVRGVGIVRNRVTDPYSVSLTTDSQRSYIADLDSPRLKPDGWESATRPAAPVAQTDMTIYELHVRDFSINDPSVPDAHRGTYLAFTDASSNGMRHLHALARAGLTDLHLLPVFDFATVPESGCVSPHAVSEGGDPAQDCFNWGYDPWHFGAPEGSYASDAADGATRVLEFRQMVMALHGIGLRVGMDVVYNHTSAAGQDAHSLLDRIVPGYYQRLDANGDVEHSTCCANTATENRMMAKLMSDTVLRWARDYRIDSFRFDLMGHQPRAAMEALKTRLAQATGRSVPLIGEGWNFGEIADGNRFVQASQLSLNGSGIGTFSDRARDAIRGGGPGDSGDSLVREQGYINGLAYDPNAMADPSRTVRDLEHAADLVRVGLAGSLRDFPIQITDGSVVPAEKIDYKGAPSGYVSQPDEVVNYVENHDNQTLFDIDALKLPRATSGDDRVRVQMLGAALVAFSQGIAYYHAGIDTLRSKSLDRNSFDSGDGFNRLDWGYQHNYFGSGLPPRADNGHDYDLLKPILADRNIAPTPAQIAMARDMFRDLLRIRASSTLFRLRSAEDVKQRLHFYNTGRQEVPTVIAGHLDGDGYPGAEFRAVLYLLNVDKVAHTLVIPEERGKAYVLHPVQASAGAADRRPATESRYDAATGTFTVPARTIAVYVVVASESAQWPVKSLGATTLHTTTYLPPGYRPGGTTRYPVLYVNDGQDMPAVGLLDTLADLYAKKNIPSIIVVAIHAPANRMDVYGYSDSGAHHSVVADSRFGPVGRDAYAYGQWLSSKLVPAIDARYRTCRKPSSRVLLGWSLGAASAFDLGWNHPDQFGIVGVFSPSFWLATDRHDVAASQATRIALARSRPQPGQRLWLTVGDAEETNDRDGDGVIDAVDDVQDFLQAYRAAGGTKAEYHLVHGGQHNQAAWKQELPGFLAWAFGPDAAQNAACR